VVYSGLWGALLASASFFYKDVLEPRTAPVNISLNLELKKINASGPPMGSGGQQLIAIEMQLGATNPSSREIFLLPNVWVAFGYRTENAMLSKEEFSQRLNRNFNRQLIRPSERYATTSDGVPIAGGILLNDSKLKPNEKVIRKLVFYLPKNTYDVLEVWTAIPSTSKAGRLLVSWRVENNLVIPEVRYATKEYPLVKRDKNGAFIDDNLELQESNSRVAIALWE